ncbi:MAG: tRNA 5-methoxyuridine(34)/uridine 5-oxyacetic acid(34) synthase CmoB [Leptospirales bacterium]
MIPVNLKYLEPYGVNIRPLERDLYLRHRYLTDPLNMKLCRALAHVPDVKAEIKNYSGSVVQIGDRSEIDEPTWQAIDQGLHSFIPWKKGPFNIFGTEIEAEWRSDLKWDRIAPYMGSLDGKVIADIGCSNGYFMFRMLDENPQLVFGIDPTRRVKLTFEYLQNFAREDKLKTELLGFEHLPAFTEVFDIIFCMGILYHHSDPVSILKNSLRALNPGGRIILETMGISGTDPVCIFPEKRYASMKNVWFIPTQTVIESWLIRAGFEDIELIFNEKLSSNEQRVTEWSPGLSLKDFLDSDNPEKTIEGYERPSRIYFAARKKNLPKFPLRNSR